MSAIKVSVIIPTYKDWARLQLCLDSLAQQSFEADAFEIIVVNNERETEVPSSITPPHNCIIINEPTPGSYAARNKALEIARGSILGFTDSDCIADVDWIKNAVSIFERDKSVSRIGGPLIIFSTKDRFSWVEMYDKIYAFPQKQYVDYGFAVTGNMFAKREVFDAVGPFDEKLQSGGDNQWGTRANAQGFKIVYADNVIINHPARDTLQELIKKDKRVGAGKASLPYIKKLSPLKVAVDLFKTSLPRRGIVRQIFEYKGAETGWIGKVKLVWLRHYLIWLRQYYMHKELYKKKDA